MEESSLDVQGIENVSLNFFPKTEQLINQQKAIICRIQRYIIFEIGELDKMPSTDIITPTVRLWQEISSLKALMETKQLEQKVKKIDDNACSNPKEKVNVTTR